MPLRRLELIALVWAAAAAGARASNVTDQVTVSRSQSTEGNPRAGIVSNSLLGHLDLNDRWTLTLGGTLTLQGQTEAAEKGAFGSSNAAVAVLTAGADFDVTDALNVGLTLDLSPSSTQHVGTQVTLTGTNGRPVVDEALLRSESSQASAGVDVSYDTAGDSDLEFSVAGGLGVTHFSSSQRIEKVRTSTGIADASQVRTYCNTHACNAALQAALRETPADLDSERFSVSGTAIFMHDTEATLGADVYHYEQNASEVGYYSVGSAGRTGGNGIPFAPPQWMVRPEVAHRFGDFTARLWLQRGQYVQGLGDSTTGAGVKVQYRFTKEFRAWAQVSGQRDTEDGGVASSSGSFGVGAAYRF